MGKIDKKKFLFKGGLCLGFIFFICQSLWASPRIKFDRINFDFGKVVQGSKVTHIFEFQNTGDETLTIKNVKAG